MLKARGISMSLLKAQARIRDGGPNADPWNKMYSAFHSNVAQSNEGLGIVLLETPTPSIGGDGGPTADPWKTLYAAFHTNVARSNEGVLETPTPSIGGDGPPKYNPWKKLYHIFSANADVQQKQPRRFSADVRKQCWENAPLVPGRHPDRWRLDAADNPVLFKLYKCQGPCGFQYDHRKPFSDGGPSTLENCQVLQTWANLLKSNKKGVTTTDLKHFSTIDKFTVEDLDYIEYVVYGNIIRPGRKATCITQMHMFEKKYPSGFKKIAGKTQALDYSM